MKNYLFLAFSILLVSCGGSDTATTASGTVINYLRKGDGSSPIDSLVSLLRIKYSTENGYVLMENSEPSPLKIETKSDLDQGELFNVLKLLKIGDSVTFELEASELFSKTFRAPLPDSIPEDSKIKFEITYTDQLTEAGYYERVQANAAKAAEKQIVIDNEILDKYFQDNNINAITTDSGLRYIIREEGSGSTPEVGENVLVNYAGYLLDGTYFDTSIEAVAKEQGLYNESQQYAPFSFPLGQGRVIKGWDEGIALLKEGTKATLYIPSTLGYGSRGSGPIIKPNAILVFDVELVKTQ